MRKVLILLIVLTFCSNSYSQKIHLSDFISMIKMNEESFDLFVNEKGFTFIENISEEYREGKNYKHNTEKYLGDKYISIYTHKGIYEYPYKKSVNFQTIYNDEYSDIKRDLLKFGFKFKESHKLDMITSNGFESIYSKNKFYGFSE